MRRSFVKFQTLSVLLCLLMAGWVQADVVLQADFDSADKLVTKGGSGELLSYSTNHTSIQTTGGLAANAGGFLRVDAKPDSSNGRVGGVMIKPESAATSLDAMSPVIDGKVTLNGAMDMFIRCSGDIEHGMNFIRVFDHNNSKANGLRIVLQSHEGRPRLELISPPSTEAFIDSRGKANRVIAYEAGLVMEADTVYHIAAGFVTDQAGMTTLTMYAVEGPTAIDIKQPLVTAQFKIDHNQLKAGFGSDAVFFGKTGVYGAPTKQDFDCFRIYNALPQTFEALK
jgi:hypothetical protein